MEEPHHRVVEEWMGQPVETLEDLLRPGQSAPKVAAVLQGIHRRSPVAKVYLLTYLPILPDDQPPIGQRGNGCWPTVPITDEDAPWVVAKEKERV